MAFLTLNREKLKTNYAYLDQLFADAGIAWAMVTKVLCGDKRYLEAIAELGIEEVCDSRVSNLKLIKQIKPSIQTVYIKPPARRSIPSIVRYADASFNSEIQTIRWLSEEAVRQQKLHKGHHHD
jgi:ornithine racemase